MEDQAPPLSSSPAPSLIVTTEQAEVSVLMMKQHCSEHVEGGTSKCGVEEDTNIAKDSKVMKKKKRKESKTEMAAHTKDDRAMKEKKKEREAEMAGNGQVPFGSTAENAGLEHPEVDMGEKEQGTKSKKSKRKHADVEPSADGSPVDEIMTDREKKKRRKERSVQLKEVDQVNMSKVAVKMRGNKKRINESDKFNPNLSNSTSTGGDEVGGDGKNRDDKKRKKKDTFTGRNDVGEHDKNDKKRKKKDTFTGRNDVGEHDKNDKKKVKKDSLTGGDGKNDKKKKKSKEGNCGRKSEKEKAVQSKDKVRRVSFADAVEVFSVNSGEDEENCKSAESEVVHGKRFTPEENVTIMEAIKNYIEMKQLGENGLEMIRTSSKHPELRGCWAEIAKSLPHRPLNAIYRRARILLFMSDERKWTPEEYEKIRRHVEMNGTSWKSLAEELGKNQIHLKDTWRRIKPKNLKKGHWTQDEYQNLFDLVNLDLQVKADQEINAGNRKWRDNIAWEAISDKLTTRNHKTCCIKWYCQLTSPLVQKGEWADTDDYRLVAALQNDDAVCIEDIDWDNLLDHRSGEICRKRWNEMVRTIGGHREKPFIEQVEVLSRRYCPEMLDYRREK
ncbi:RNA polymerase I termination factor [Oryza brachyantha]|uniref:RNA polymerase I termination factor n=1 Tax=Oryza brachyantha TaxID=4533 RepID=UPI001AD9AEFC|nr:RNA polymerase I termination factor [Oryza brachyantha]